MPTPFERECEHEIGRKAIGGFAGHRHVHATGNQLCFKCGKYLTELLKDSYLLGSRAMARKVREKFENIARDYAGKTPQEAIEEILASLEKEIEQS